MQLDAIDTSLVDREIYPKLDDDLEGFCATLQNKMKTASVTDRQGVLRLVVKGVIVGSDKITFRRTIPVRANAASPTEGSTETDSKDEHAAIVNCVGGVVSPVLDNLVLRRAFDAFLARQFPTVPRDCRSVAVVRPLVVLTLLAFFGCLDGRLPLGRVTGQVTVLCSLIRLRPAIRRGRGG